MDHHVLMRLTFIHSEFLQFIILLKNDLSGWKSHWTNNNLHHTKLIFTFYIYIYIYISILVPISLTIFKIISLHTAAKLITPTQKTKRAIYAFNSMKAALDERETHKRSNFALPLISCMDEGKCFHFTE